MIVSFLVILIAAGFALWFFLDADRYRSRVEAELAELTGLPVQSGRFNLDFWPSLRLEIDGATIGEDDFRVDAGAIEAWADLRALLGGKILVTDVAVSGLALHLPVDVTETQERIAKVQENVLAYLGPEDERPDEPSFVDRISIDQIRSDGVSVYFGDEDEAGITADARVAAVLSDDISGTIALSGPKYGDDVSGSAEWNVTQNAAGEITGMTAKASAKNVPIQGFTELREQFHAKLSLDAELSGLSVDNVQFSVNGTIDPATEDLSNVALQLAGAFEGDRLVVSELTADSEGAVLLASAEFDADGAFFVSVENLTLQERPLVFALENAVFRTVDVVAGKDAYARLQNAKLTREEGAETKLASGTFTFDGFALSQEDGTTLSKNTTGEIKVVDNTLEITKFEGDAFDLRGTVRPDFDAGLVAVSMRGRVDLHPQWLEPFLDEPIFPQLGGVVNVESFTGTFGGKEAIPPDLQVAAKLQNASVTVDTDGFKESFSAINGSAGTRDGKLIFDLSADSESLDRIAAALEYEFESAKCEGTVTLDVRGLTPLITDDEELREQLRPILAAYGLTTARVAAALPTEDRDSITVTVVREEFPPVNATVAMLRENGEYVLGDVTANTAAPDTALAHLLPEDVTLSGTTAITFTRQHGAGTFTANVDLKRAGIAAGDYIEKRPEEPLMVVVQGRAAGEDWAPERIDVAVAGQQAVLTLKDDGVEMKQTKLDLAPMSVLLREPGKMAGAVELEFVSAPLTFDVAFLDAAIALEPELALDRVDGRLTYREGVFTSPNLNIRGADSDCIVSIEHSQEGYTGSIKGTTLNVDSVLALADAVFALQPESAGPSEFAPAPQPAPEPETEAEPLNGRIDVALNTVHYGRGEITDVSAVVSMENGDILIRDVSMKPYSGTVTGAVNILQQDGGKPAVFKVNADISEVDARLADDILFEEPMGLEGIVTGKVDFTTQLVEDGDYMAYGDGTITADAVDGTFGNKGLASKILTALHATDVLRGKLPKLRDEGLAYDTCTSELVFVKGNMTVRKFELKTEAYEMRASGDMNFAKNETYIPIEFDVIKGATGLLEKVPVVGQIPQLAAVRLTAEGPPDDVHIKIASVKDYLVGTVRTGGDVLLESVKDVFNILTLGKGIDEEKQKEKKEEKKEKKEEKKE